MLGSTGARVLRRSASADRLVTAATTAAMQHAPQPPAAPAAVAGAASSVQQRQLALRFRGYRLGLRVPSEMWGAAALALRLAQSGAGSAPQLHRSASVVIAQAFSAATAPTAAPPPPGPISEDHPKALAEALDWRPQLTPAEDLASLLLPAAACVGVYTITAPATVQPMYAAGMAVLYALMIVCLRWVLLEQRYKAVQRSERDLAAADSRFVNVDGLYLHFKRRAPLRPPGTISSSSGGGGGGGVVANFQPPAAVVHCLHGFGASSYSWSFVQQELADALHAVVTAHDMPGFGLSQRTHSPAYYTLHFNGDAARHIMDAELAAQQAQQAGLQGEGQPAPAPAEVRQAWAQQAGQPALEWQQRLRRLEWRSHPLAGLSGSSSSLASDVDGDSSDSAADGRQGTASSGVAAGSTTEGSQAQPTKRILVGHSMGGAAVAEGVISNPEGIAALVLVAPAIVALWLGPPEEAAGDPVATGLAVVEELVAAEDAPGAIDRLPSDLGAANSSSGRSSSPRLSRSDSSSCSSSSRRASSSSDTPASGISLAARANRGVRTAVAIVKAVLMLTVRMILAAATPLLVLVLRRLIRDRRFWERGLASAWHDAARLPAGYVDAYRSGQLVRGWEGGILRFLAARFSEKAGFWGSLREAVQGTAHLTQAERLARVVRRHGIRVLIVHGASDALVPAANSRRLASLLPNAEFVLFEECGHMPQEECPERFVETVQQFVQSLE